MTRWAIDANIFMQQATRRLVCGAIEYRHDDLLIARTADAMRQVLHRARDHPERMTVLVAANNLYGMVERTRAAERRLVSGERDALANVAVPATPPLAGHSHGDGGLPR